MPRLSIIVPVYNAKAYLQRCVDSILAQTYRDYELILVDDGSTDGSNNICDSFTSLDNRIKVFHQTNKGLSSARNRGVKVATGEIIGFVDSDDWIEPQMFEQMITALEENDSDIVICRVRLIEEDVDRIIGHEDKMILSKHEGTKEILRDDVILSFAWNKIYKRSLFKDIEYPEGRIYEDTATTYKLFYESNKIVSLPLVGYNYWQNPKGICRKRVDDIKEYIKRELDNALAFDERYVFAKHHEGLEEVVSLCAYKAYRMIRCFIHMLGHKKYLITEEQEAIVDRIMHSFDTKDLIRFSTFEKMDLYLFRVSKRLLKTYVNIIPLFRKMKE